MSKYAVRRKSSAKKSLYSEAVNKVHNQENGPALNKTALEKYIQLKKQNTRDEATVSN